MRPQYFLYLRVIFCYLVTDGQIKKQNYFLNDCLGGVETEKKKMKNPHSNEFFPSF